jgi:hypothetical protein
LHHQADHGELGGERWRQGLGEVPAVAFGDHGDGGGALGQAALGALQGVRLADQQRAQPRPVDQGAAREAERQAVDQIDHQGERAEVFGVEGEARQLEDADLVLGGEPAQPAPEIGLKEEAALQRQAAEKSPGDAEHRRNAGSAIEDDPASQTFRRRRLTALRPRAEQRHLVLRGEQLEPLHGAQLISPPRRPGIARGDEEEFQAKDLRDGRGLKDKETISS